MLAKIFRAKRACDKFHLDRHDRPHNLPSAIISTLSINEIDTHSFLIVLFKQKEKQIYKVFPSGGK